LRHDEGISTVIRPGSPATRRTVDVTDPQPDTSPRDGRIFQAAGVLMVLGGALLALGSFAPWVSYVFANGAALGKNAYEFGPGDSWTWFGPIILLGATALAVFGVATLFHPWRPNLCMALIPTLCVGLEIADMWDGGFGAVRHATTTIGPGSLLCYAGLALGVAAAVLLLPAERARTR
jgi:hypothetical protein